MTYELAKELKDAGFKGDPEAVKPVFHENREQPGKGLLIYEPTLSELIEACGEDFDALTCTAPYGWNASYFRGSHNKATRASVSAPTAIEAVAKAWLGMRKR